MNRNSETVPNKFKKLGAGKMKFEDGLGGKRFIAYQNFSPIEGGFLPEKGFFTPDSQRNVRSFVSDWSLRRNTRTVKPYYGKTAWYSSSLELRILITGN